MAKTGRPKLINSSQHRALRALVKANPAATHDQLVLAWQAHSGHSISAPTLKRALIAAGLKRIKAPVAQTYARDLSLAQRYGYTERHRREAGCFAGSLTDAEWVLAQDIFELPAGARGRPPLHARRAMVDACCFVLRTGCSWRTLPKEVFPPWPAVQKAFSRWAELGKFERLQDRLRQQWRQRVERTLQPSAALIDSQSTRISPQGGAQGFDAGKKVKGRKRHLVVDTLGLILAVVVTSAALQDRDAAAVALQQAQEKTGQSIKTLFADSAYAGRCAALITKDQAVEVQIIRRMPRGQWDDPQQPLWPEQSEMKVLPKRWVVERTHAWLEKHRRLIMHHDRKVETSRAWVWLAQARMLLARLA